MTTLTTIPPGFWDTMNVTSMTECFQQCTQWSEDIQWKRRMKDRRLKIEKLRNKNGIL